MQSGAQRLLPPLKSRAPAVVAVTVPVCWLQGLDPAQRWTVAPVKSPAGRAGSSMCWSVEVFSATAQDGSSGSEPELGQRPSIARPPSRNRAFSVGSSGRAVSAATRPPPASFHPVTTSVPSTVTVPSPYAAKVIGAPLRPEGGVTCSRYVPWWTRQVSPGFTSSAQRATVRSGFRDVPGAWSDPQVATSYVRPALSWADAAPGSANRAAAAAVTREIDRYGTLTHGLRSSVVRAGAGWSAGEGRYGGRGRRCPAGTGTTGSEQLRTAHRDRRRPGNPSLHQRPSLCRELMLR